MSKNSELFERIFETHCSGCLRVCKCGRTHFDSSDNGWDWEEGELENLLKKSKEDPDKYVEHDCSVGTMRIGYDEIVYGCLCHLAQNHENFIIQNAEGISEYLRGRAKWLREKADKIDVPKN